MPWHRGLGGTGTPWQPCGSQAGEGGFSPGQPFSQRVPPGFLGVCCWFRSQLGAVQGRHLVGSQRAAINLSGRRAWGRGGRGAPRQQQPLHPLNVDIPRAAVSVGCPVKQWGGTSWAGMLTVPCWDWDHHSPVPLHLPPEPEGKFQLQRGTRCTGSQAGLTPARLPDCFGF